MKQLPEFDWRMLGNISEGRPNLGLTTDVLVYRMMQLGLRAVLIKEFGAAATERVFFEAGRIAGAEFYKNLPTKPDSIPEFIGELQEQFKRLRMGILRVEKAETEPLNLILTVAEDVSCSGLPVSGEEVCTYDEGFLAGLLSGYTKREFNVKEVDCWCSGDRVCRFEAKPAQQEPECSRSPKAQ